MKKKTVLLIMLLLLIVFVCWMIWGNITVGVTHDIVTSRRLPPAFHGFKIAMVSDFHNAQFGADNTPLLSRIREQAPDIIAITGDFVDCRRTDLEIAEQLVKELTQIAPCYYVPGNHEARIGENKARLEQAMLSAGVVILHDASVPLTKDGETIRILGLDDSDFAGTTANVRDKLAQLSDTDAYSILLSHRPELFETYVAENVDLALCGHAHGGQFRLPFIGGLFAPNQGLFPKYDAGTVTKNNTTMVISRGLGNSSFPVRFNNRPEVVLVQLFCAA